MCIALHLIYKCLKNEPLPEILPTSMVHPMKRVQCAITLTSNNSDSLLSQQRRFSKNIISPPLKNCLFYFLIKF